VKRTKRAKTSIDLAAPPSDQPIDAVSDCYDWKSGTHNRARSGTSAITLTISVLTLTISVLTLTSQYRHAKGHEQQKR
jgi:hypothetical protein